MKKVVLYVLAASCLLTFCSCSGGSAEESTASTVSTTESMASNVESANPDESLVSNVISESSSTEISAVDSSNDVLADWASRGSSYEYTGNDKIVVIPDEVGPICPYILNNDTVEEIVVPASITGVSARKEAGNFFGCPNLKKVTFLNPNFDFKLLTSLNLELFGLKEYQFNDDYVRKITIVGYKGSTAEKMIWQKNPRTKNGMLYDLTFEAIEE